MKCRFMNRRSTKTFFTTLAVSAVIFMSCRMTYGQSRYRCLDPQLKLDVIHSDPAAFYISMDMDPRGNLYVGGRDAVYLFEADEKGGFKARKTITKLPKHTWAYSLQVAGDDLYVLTVTALYRLPNVIRDPGNVKFERLVWGIPLGHIHQGFHGMRMGPDGSLLLAFGDPHPGPFRSRTNPGHVWHWTFLSGSKTTPKKLPWTGVGGVVRYDPQSHGLHVVSRGFRNICDLAVDEHWNVFGNDNDQEGSPLHTLGRLVHVTDGSHYQWSRGWLAAVEPHRNDLIQTLVANTGRFVPFGTCYYNEDHLGESYKRSLFVARWGSRELGQFPLSDRGASFKSRQKTLISGNGTARPVAVSTGNDGRLFVSVCFMERNEASPVRRTDLVMISNPKRPWKSSAYDASSVGIDRLVGEVQSSSWRRRFNAHREIMSRGLTGNQQVVDQFLKCKVTNPAWHSLAWLARRSKDARVFVALKEALKSSDARVIAAAADILNRFHQLDKTQIQNLIAHHSPVVQLAGLRNMVVLDRADFVETITALSSNKDSHVRQLAMRRLGQIRSFKQLEKQFSSGDLSARRVALSAAMWKWIDTVESGSLPKEVKLSPAQAKHLSSFSYVDDPNSNLLTESKKHGFTVGGLSLMDWWRQTTTSNAAAPSLQRMIAKATLDKHESHRKTAAVFANTLGMNSLAFRVPALIQTRSAKAKLVKGAKLSANKDMPAAYRKIDWSQAWMMGNAKTGAQLFKQRCAACHDSGKGGGTIGPSLAGVASRFKPQYLAESVAVPSKDISPNFQAWSVSLKHVESFDDETELLGFLAGDNVDQLTLQLMDGTLKAIKKSNIKSKAASETSLMPVGLITGPDELKHIVKYLMTLKATSDTSIGTGDSSSDSALVEVYRQVNPLKANEFRFAPIEAKYVRVNVLDSNRGQPCIDELEIFSPGSSQNIARQTNGAKATASSLLQGYDKHKVEHLNDGKHGNLRSWIPAEITGWAQIELPKSAKIDRVVLSRDRGGELTRRNPIAFDILVSNDGKKWKTVKKVRPPKTGANSLVPKSNERLAAVPESDTNRPSAKPSLPNIVLILADDFGWGDTSCNNPGSPIKTPQIDRIAREGIRFTNAHTPSAVCTPTRYGLLTGRYPWRSYLKKHVLSYYAPALIQKGRTTVASYLKSQGYRTGGFGKWHLGLDWTPVAGDPQNWRSHWNTRDRKQAARVAKSIDHTKPFGNAPTDIGFDTYFGTASNAGRLPFFIQDNRVVGKLQRNKTGAVLDPKLSRDTVDDIYVDKAIAFIESHEKNDADRPFFVYLPLNAIHGAVKVPKRFEGKTGMTQREDKIHWADQNVGRILQALDRMKLGDDTLLIFTTDNGPLNSPVARKKGHEPTGPYRGFKTCAWDGGTRVPFVARWPGHIPAGAKSNHLVGLVDMLATFAALCENPLPDSAGPDSVNQLPALLQQKEKITPRPAMVTATYRGLLALRKDKWKVIFGTKWSGGHTNENYGGLGPDKTMDDPKSGQLYNLELDPHEQNDLWERRPEIVEQLRREMARIEQLDASDKSPVAATKE
jgi:arylsulfatase A